MSNELDRMTEQAQALWEHHFANKTFRCHCDRFIALGLQTNGLIHVEQCAHCQLRYFFYPTSGEAHDIHDAPIAFLEGKS